MIDTMMQGHLVSKPEAHTDAKGRIYTTAMMQAETARGEPELMFLITHTPPVGLTLQSMDVGDSVSVSGPLTIKRDGTAAVLGCNVRKMLSFHPTVRLPR